MAHCDCIYWCRTTPMNIDEHHHPDCPKYQTENFPRLFYWDECMDAWVLAPDLITAIVGDDTQEQHFSIKFKWHDMTDQEVADLPQD